MITGSRSLVYGVGINDFNGSISKEGKHMYEYKLWKEMLRRCYSESFKVNRPTYSDCVVDEDLLFFAKFYEFITGKYGFLSTDENGRLFHMDKDILGSGNIYSKDTICFVPHEINAFLTNKKSVESKYPIGVLFHKASGKLISQITINGKRKYIGLFDNPMDAFFAYKIEKEKQAKCLAFKYKDEIETGVFLALLSYQVNIDD